MQTPVLIVGAGPTGLTAALNLTQQGIACIIVDKRPEPTQTSNALALQSRTLESLEKLGIMSELQSRGHPILGLKIHSQADEIGQINLSQLPTKYPYILGLPQCDTEQILLDKLASYNVQVLRDTEVIDFQQGHEKIEVTCQSAGQQPLQITTKWMLGCDGSHSLIREKLQIPYEGKDLAKHFIMADIPRNENYKLPYDYANGFLSPQGTMVLIPLKTFYRIIIDVSENKELDQIKNPPLLLFQALSQQLCPFSLGLEKELWSSGFWIHEHVVNTYYKNNIFLLGDAAHEHSPMGGQGMNTGIQDAINLTWKLALVEKNQLKRETLSSYQDERLPVAQNVVSKTTIATHIITLKSKLLIQLRNHVMKMLLNNALMLHKITQTISELAINYFKSPWVGESGTWTAGIKPGARVPGELQMLLEANQFTLFVFAGNSEKTNATQFIHHILTKHVGLFKVVVVSPVNLNIPNTQRIDDQHGEIAILLGIHETGFYLARPDGYIAYRASLLDESTFAACCTKVGIHSFN